MTVPSTTTQETLPELIQSQADFDQLMVRLRTEPLLAVDTEAASFHRYHDRVYLIQVSSRATTAVIDPLAVGDLALLGELIATPAIEVVFHDADYDLRILDRDYGFRAANLFDTRIAAQLLNEPGIGLAALLDKFFGIHLDKKYQRADWSARPLSPPMLAYAAADTRYLPALRDRLRVQLQAVGRWSWAREEFDLLEAVRWSPAALADEAYLRLKGARRLTGRARTVLRELYEWREATARQFDRALFRVLSNEALLALAEASPTDQRGLRAVAGISTQLVARQGDQLLAAVRRGLDAPFIGAPVFDRASRPLRDLEVEARLDLLKAARNQLASDLDLAPGVLCPNGTLEAIARAQPRTREDLGRIAGLKRWQAEVTGNEFLRVLDPRPQDLSS